MFVKRVMLALLCALTATAARAGDDRYANIHSVAIVSTLGDGILLKRDSDFVGETAADVVLHTGQDIDGYIAGTIRNAVASRFTVIDAAFDPALLKDYPVPPALLQILRARFAQSPGAAVDAIIVVHPNVIQVRSPPPFVTMTYQYSGLSLTHTRGLFGSYGNLLSAQYAVSVIDARTGKVIDALAGRLPPMGLFGARPSPILTCSNQIWPDLPEHPSQAQTQQIGADLMAIIAMSLPNALPVANPASQGGETWLTEWQGRKLMCKQLD